MKRNKKMYKAYRIIVNYLINNIKISFTSAEYFWLRKILHFFSNYIKRASLKKNKRNGKVKIG